MGERQGVDQVAFLLLWIRSLFFSLQFHGKALMISKHPDLNKGVIYRISVLCFTEPSHQFCFCLSKVQIWPFPLPILFLCLCLHLLSSLLEGEELLNKSSSLQVACRIYPCMTQREC